MNKSFGNSCNCPVFSHRGCGPDSTYTRIKPCQKNFDFFIAWPFAWVLHSTPARNQHW